MNEYKILSVVIPVYNLGNHIIRTLESLVKQDLRKIEIIIIDDGSTDNSMLIAEEFLTKYPEIDYKIIQKPNGGVSSARNKGIAEANGEYIFFLDGDDYVVNNFFDILSKEIINNSSDIFCWGYDIVSEKNKVIKSYFGQYNSNAHIMSGVDALKNIIIDKNMWIWTCSAIYKKEFILRNKLWYTEGCVNGEDREFTYKALLKASEVTFINEVLSFYVQRDGSISNSYNIKRFDAIYAMQRVVKTMEELTQPRLYEISSFLKDQHIITDYFYNLHSCYSNSNGKSITQILGEIEEHYPRLNYEMKLIMDDYTSDNFKERLRYKLFLKSPKLYFNLIGLKNKLTRQ